MHIRPSDKGQQLNSPSLCPVQVNDAFFRRKCPQPKVKGIYGERMRERQSSGSGLRSMRENVYRTHVHFQEMCETFRTPPSVPDHGTCAFTACDGKQPRESISSLVFRNVSAGERID